MQGTAFSLLPPVPHYLFKQNYDLNWEDSGAMLPCVVPN